MTAESHITKGKHLAWNTLLNLGTGVFIMGLNVIFVPLMLHAFGTEFYGVLSVTWMVLANFSWLDFGFSRASARYVSQELILGNNDKAALWTWTAVVSQAFLGAVGALVAWSLAPYIVDHIHVQPQNRDLVILTLKLFAFSIPIDFAIRSLNGVMQAGQRFDWANGLNIFNTLCTFGVYGIGILNGSNFKTVVCGLFVLRIVNVLAAYWGAAQALPSLKSLDCLRHLTEHYWERALVLVRYGWWVASASVVGPLLLLFDQWMISVIIGVSLLPYYTVPSNLLWRLGIFPTSLTTTLFPAFSAMEAKTQWGRIENYFIRAHRYLCTILLPVLFVLFVWGGEILRIWIGPAFAEKSTLPLQLLVFGFVVGLLAPLSGALLEAVGRPDILVKLYLVELPLNVVVVWFLTKRFGIAGAALSYTVRTVLETLILWFVVHRIVPFSMFRLLRKSLLQPSIAMVILAFASFWMRKASIYNQVDIGVTLLLLAAYGLFAYYMIFDREDRVFTVGFYQSKKERLFARIFRRQVAVTGGGNS